MDDYYGVCIGALTVFRPPWIHPVVGQMLQNRSALWAVVALGNGSDNEEVLFTMMTGFIE